MQREPLHNIPKSILPNVLKHLTWNKYVHNKSVWWNISHVATFLVLAIDKSISLPETTNLWRYISKTLEDGISRKTAISYPLIRTRTCAYQGSEMLVFQNILRSCLMDDPSKITHLSWTERNAEGVSFAMKILAKTILYL